MFREREKKANKTAMNGGPITKLDKIKDSLKNGDNTQVLLQRVNTSADLTDKKKTRSNVDLPTYLKENEKVERMQFSETHDLITFAGTGRSIEEDERK